MKLSCRKNKRIHEGIFWAQKIKNPTLKKFIILPEIELSCFKLKNLLYLASSLKNSHIFSKKSFSYTLGRTSKAPKTKFL